MSTNQTLIAALFAVAAVIAVAGCRPGGPAAAPGVPPDAAAEKPHVNEPAVIDLTGTRWELLQLRGESIGAEHRPVLRFEDGKAPRIAGTAFVNHYWATVVVGPDSAVRFEAMRYTEMAGPLPLMRKEAKYFSALRDVDAYSAEADSLTLREGDEPLLRFGRK